MSVSMWLVGMVVNFAVAGQPIFYYFSTTGGVLLSLGLLLVLPPQHKPINTLAHALQYNEVDTFSTVSFHTHSMPLIIQGILLPNKHE